MLFAAGLRQAFSSLDASWGRFCGPSSLLSSWSRKGGERVCESGSLDLFQAELTAAAPLGNPRAIHRTAKNPITFITHDAILWGYEFPGTPWLHGFALLQAFLPNVRHARDIFVSGFRLGALG